MNFTTNLKKLVLSFVLILSFAQSRASHVMNLDLTYQWLHDSTYKIVVVIYVDCGAVPGIFSTMVDSTYPEITICNNGILVDTIRLSIDTAATRAGSTSRFCTLHGIDTSSCTSTSTGRLGVRKYVYSKIQIFPTSATPYSLYYSGSNSRGNNSGRASAITNIYAVSTEGSLATLNNSLGPNSSPVLNDMSNIATAIHHPFTYSPGAYDLDGDSLYFELFPAIQGIPGWGGCTTRFSTVHYNAGCTYDTPMITSTFSFDHATGDMSFNMSIIQRPLVTYKISEYRRGVLVGSTIRELCFLANDSMYNTPTLPRGIYDSSIAATLIDSTHLQVMDTTGAFSAYINPTDPDTSVNVKVTLLDAPTGATLTVTGDSTRHPHCVFNWNTTSVAPGMYVFHVNLKNDACPLYGQSNKTYYINVMDTAHSTAINAHHIANSLHIAPNPSSGRFTISGIATGVTTTFEVYDITGKRVLTDVANGTSPSQVLDLSNCANGVYIVKVLAAGLTSYQRILKQ